MSVINQVLNQIEQRGAPRLPGQNMVRAVPPVRDFRKLKITLLVLGIASAVGALAWQWQLTRTPVAAAKNVLVKALTVVATPVSGIEGKPTEETPAPGSRAGSELSAVSSASSNAETNSVAIATTAKPLNLSTRPLLNPHTPPTDRYVATTRPLNETSKPIPNHDNLPVTRAAAPASGDELPMKQISPVQQADAEFHKASGLAQQGDITNAIAGYEAALRLNAGHDAARQALAALLLDSKRGAEAERVLHNGIKNRPEQAGFAMLLARLQVERGAIGEALATLEKSLPFADQQADYQAFLAALLQRQNRHNEAITHYQIVLQLAPNNGIWLMGYGISLRAVQRNAEAKDAFKRALASQMLSPELREFVQQKLKGL